MLKDKILNAVKNKQNEVTCKNKIFYDVLVKSIS